MPRSPSPSASRSPSLSPPTSPRGSYGRSRAGLRASRSLGAKGRATRDATPRCSRGSSGSGGMSTASAVRVVVRFRPPVCAEEQLSRPAFIVEPGCAAVESADLQHRFQFDYVFGQHADQQEVFDYMGRPVVDGVLDGYHGTILAYGQTGSGKTYCMFGPQAAHSARELQGVVPRATRRVFDGLVDHGAIETTVECSFFEVYCGQVRDLLRPQASSRHFHITEFAQRGVSVEGLVSKAVKSANEAQHLFRTGLRHRSAANTRLNQHSSRSHAIFSLRVHHRAPDGTEKHGKLTLVDLAGSEKVHKSGSAGEMLEEAKKINFSLSALGHVIDALADRRPHVPYRDSRLTRILADSLGGNCRTTMVVACSPSATHASETLSSLRFAARAKKVCNCAKANLRCPSPGAAADRQLLHRIAQLRRELASAHGELERRFAQTAHGGIYQPTSPHHHSSQLPCTSAWVEAPLLPTPPREQPKWPGAAAMGAQIAAHQANTASAPAPTAFAPPTAPPDRRHTSDGVEPCDTLQMQWDKSRSSSPTRLGGSASWTPVVASATADDDLAAVAVAARDGIGTATSSVRSSADSIGGSVTGGTSTTYTGPDASTTSSSQATPVLSWREPSDYAEVDPQSNPGCDSWSGSGDDGEEKVSSGSGLPRCALEREAACKTNECPDEASATTPRRYSWLIKAIPITHNISSPKLDAVASAIAGGVASNAVQNGGVKSSADGAGGTVAEASFRGSRLLQPSTLSGDQEGNRGRATTRCLEERDDGEQTCARKSLEWRLQLEQSRCAALTCELDRRAKHSRELQRKLDEAQAQASPASQDVKGCVMKVGHAADKNSPTFMPPSTAPEQISTTPLGGLGGMFSHRLSSASVQQLWPCPSSVSRPRRASATALFDPTTANRTPSNSSSPMRFKGNSLRVNTVVRPISPCAASIVRQGGSCSPAWGGSIGTPRCQATPPVASSPPRYCATPRQHVSTVTTMTTASRPHSQHGQVSLPSLNYSTAHVCNAMLTPNIADVPFAPPAWLSCNPGVVLSASPVRQVSPSPSPLRRVVHASQGEEASRFQSPSASPLRKSVTATASATTWPHTHSGWAQPSVLGLPQTPRTPLTPHNGCSVTSVPGVKESDASLEMRSELNRWINSVI